MISKHIKLALMVTAFVLPISINAQPATPFNTPTAKTPFNTAPTPQAQKPLMTPAAPNIDATGFVLMDAYSGKVIASKNPDQKMPPASLTKMMTSYIVSAALDAKRIHLDDPVPISKEAWQTGGSKMFVKVGTQVPVRELMQGMIVDSGNDACVALAEFVAGSQDAFVNLMNQQAAILGMKNTHFMDVNGLPDAGHYSSPRDLAILGRALVLDFPQDYQWYSQKWFTYNNIKQPNRNRLLWSDPSVDGIKTGHTDEAGYCLVASAQRNGTRLISVVMGTPSDNSRASDSQQLLTYGFRFFTSHKLYAAGTSLARSRVWLGQKNTVAVGPAKDLYVTLPTQQDAALKTDIKLQPTINAPVKKGQSVGEIMVTLNGTPLATEPLVALEDNPEGGLWRRMSDHVGQMFSRLL